MKEGYNPTEAVRNPYSGWLLPKLGGKQEEEVAVDSVPEAVALRPELPEVPEATMEAQLSVPGTVALRSGSTMEDPVPELVALGTVRTDVCPKPPTPGRAPPSRSEEARRSGTWWRWRGKSPTAVP